MATTIQVELLKDAYAIIGGIPDQLINLENIRSHVGPSLDCGTICCGIGWLAQHPQFNALGLELYRHLTIGGMVQLHGQPIFYREAASRLFGITKIEAAQLFDPVAVLPKLERQRIASIGHKNELLNRIMKLLESHKAVRHPKYFI